MLLNVHFKFLVACGRTMFCSRTSTTPGLRMHPFRKEMDALLWSSEKYRSEKRNTTCFFRVGQFLFLYICAQQVWTIPSQPPSPPWLICEGINQNNKRTGKSPVAKSIEKYIKDYEVVKYPPKVLPTHFVHITHPFCLRTLMPTFTLADCPLPPAPAPDQIKTRDNNWNLKLKESKSLILGLLSFYKPPPKFHAAVLPPSVVFYLFYSVGFFLQKWR